MLRKLVLLFSLFATPALANGFFIIPSLGVEGNTYSGPSAHGGVSFVTMLMSHRTNAFIFVTPRYEAGYEASALSLIVKGGGFVNNTVIFPIAVKGSVYKNREDDFKGSSLSLGFDNGLSFYLGVQRGKEVTRDGSVKSKDGPFASIGIGF